MKSLRLLILLLTALSPFAYAADSTVPLHWYRITITYGDSITSLTGSSPLDATQMSASLSNASPIPLENRREQFASERPKLEYGWHPYEPGSKVFIFPRAVLYFEELAGDPAAQSQ